jgi:hypothetical protein
MVAIVCFYHLPLARFDMFGDCMADLPSDVLPG